MRHELAALWDRSSASKEQLLRQLQDWCRRADASGIAPLVDFSQRLRSYASSGKSLARVAVDPSGTKLSAFLICGVPPLGTRDRAFVPEASTTSSGIPRYRTPKSAA